MWHEADITEGFRFALFGEHREKLFQQSRAFGVDCAVFFPAKKVIERAVVGVLFLLIDFARGNAVAKHLDHESYRHLHRAGRPGLRIVIAPIFKMMAVAALVVHPGEGVPVSVALSFVWAAASLIIFCADPEFGWAVF